MVRPRLFIGSSTESLKYSYAIQEELEDSAEVTVWTQGIFKLTKTSIESLIMALENYDFAVFVFAPNDVVRLRRQNYTVVRDNVVFELGLFMGKLGRPRVFIVVPKGSERLRIPTDLAGLMVGKFDPNRTDKNLRAAFGPFCTEVRRQIRSRRTKAPSKPRRSVRIDARPKGNFFFTDAAYGIQDHRVEVTAQLNALVVDDKIHTYVGNQLAGDPCPNTPKNLVVKYKYKNQEFEKIFNEGETLDLP